MSDVSFLEPTAVIELDSFRDASGLLMMHPLAGLKVIEFEGIGPGPLAGRMLADLGAEVVAVVRPDKAPLGDPDRPLCRRSAAARKADRALSI